MVRPFGLLCALCWFRYLKIERCVFLEMPCPAMPFYVVRLCLAGKGGGGLLVVLEEDHDVAHPLDVRGGVGRVVAELDELADLLPRVVVLDVGLQGLELLLLVGAVGLHPGLALGLPGGLEGLEVGLGLLEGLGLLGVLGVLAVLEGDLPLVVPDGHGGGPGGLLGDDRLGEDHGAVVGGDGLVGGGGELDGLGPGVLGGGREGRGGVLGGGFRDEDGVAHHGRGGGGVDVTDEAGVFRGSGGKGRRTVIRRWGAHEYRRVGRGRLGGDLRGRLVRHGLEEIRSLLVRHDLCGCWYKCLLCCGVGVIRDDT
mmetsp:Transcript_17373/g.49732  ORF Transcript_17373/g.49732 Transcript_17373/m.49732 type:complete len:311 (-) Transcript_17373:13-945(-)